MHGPSLGFLQAAAILVLIHLEGLAMFSKQARCLTVPPAAKISKFHTRVTKCCGFADAVSCLVTSFRNWFRCFLTGSRIAVRVCKTALFSTIDIQGLLIKDTPLQVRAIYVFN